ncbi:hypothetical protein ACOMHN_010540 [Nucella lapillus]
MLGPTRQTTLPFNSVDLSVSSSQQSEAETVGDVTVVKNEAMSLGDQLQDNTIASWLTGLGLSAYIDNFHQKGLVNLFQLDDFNLEALSQLKIGQAHRTKIWNALLEWRKMVNTVDLSQLHPSFSNASDITLASQNSLSQQSAYNPEYLEITRYSFKQVISFDRVSNDEHSDSHYKLRKRKSNTLGE